MDTDLVSSVTKKLLACEYPFQWKPRNDLESYPEDILDRTRQKISEKSTETEFQFEVIMLHILLGYEYHVHDAVSDSIKSFDFAEATLKSAENDANEQVLRRLSNPILHVIRASKAYVAAHANELERAFEISSNIPEISSNDAQGVAALIGLRGVFFSEYGICGSKLGLKYATEANIMDPKESLWCFLKGKYLGRIRRVEKPFDIPSPEEVQILERAIKLEQNAAYSVFTAQLYRETANRTFRLHRSKETLFPLLKEKIDKLNEESLKLYKQSIELRPNCVHMLFRCAKGLMSLPVPFRDDDEAKKLLKKGLKQSPESGYGNHVMAQFYERREKNSELAMVHLRKCKKYKVFGACMDLLRLEYKNNPFGVEEELEKMLDVFHEPARKCQILSQLASYYIFTSHNIPKACEYFEKCIRINPKCDDMLHHRPLTVATFEVHNLYDIIVDEIKIQLLDENCLPEQRNTYEALLNDFRETGINVPTQLPQYLKKQIVDKVNSFKKPRHPKPRGGVRRYNLNIRSSRPTQQQPLSWRNQKQQGTEQFKTDTIKKIEDMASAWKVKCGEKQEQLNTTNKNKKPSDDTEDDEDSDVALQAKIYAKVGKAVSNESKSNRNDVSEDDDSDIQLAAQIFKKTQKLKKETDERKPSSTEDNSGLSSSLQRMRLIEKSRSSKETSSPEDDDGELSNTIRKMRLNVDHGRLKTGERGSHHRKDVTKEDDFNRDVLAYRKMKEEKARSSDCASYKSSRSSAITKRIYGEERYADKRCQSVTSKSTRSSKDKYVRASDRDSRSNSDSDGYKRKKGGYSSRRESSYERKSTNYKPRRSDRSDDYRPSESKCRNYDSVNNNHSSRHKSDRKHETDNRHHQKEKSKPKKIRDSSSSDEAELIENFKKLTADFQPRTIKF